MKATLGPIWQLAYVVDDLEAAVLRWVGRGAGPFFRRAPEPAPFFDRFYGGAPAPAYDTKVALGQFGSVMLELIVPPEGGLIPSTPGLHHIATFPPDFDAALAACQQRGQSLLLRGETPGTGARYAYIDTVAECGHAWELQEPVPLFLELVAAVAAAANDWDGEEPFRS